METTGDQLAEAFYQKVLALLEIESLKGEKASGLAATEGAKDVGKASEGQPDLFEESFIELKKWVDVKSSKYGSLLVLHERRSGRLGTALKMIQSLQRRSSMN